MKLSDCLIKLQSVKLSNIAKLVYPIVIGFVCFIVGSKGCPRREYTPVVAPWTRPTIEHILRDTLKVPFWNILTKTVKADTVYRVIIQPPPAESLVKIFWGSYDGKTLQLAYYKDSLNDRVPFSNVNTPFTFTSRSQDVIVKCARKFPLRFGLGGIISVNHQKELFSEMQVSCRYRWFKVIGFAATDRGLGGGVGFEL